MGRKAQAKKPHTERVIRFPTPLYDRLREKAEREQRSIQGQVVYELEQVVKD